ncbi:ATP-dependent DNA helicase PIF1 [Senna tora]|uniref:ATP-dependent DNA helicase n=1 Tax=Senna tora TaxID=362788 RepID=A0A834SS58_9FABA|nr:ATP-dependent DNA helicase PIF1 [Senna tora]
MLDSLNPLVQVFRSMKNHPSTSNRDNLSLKLIKKQQTDARVYNLPTADEIGTLIVGDFDLEKGARDIIVEKRSGTLQRISELHPLYLPLQYRLLFQRGDDGYREDAALARGQTTSSGIGKRIVLPSTFTGELCRLFESLNCKPQDRPDLLSRVFKIKLNSPMRDITKNFLFGSCRAEIPDPDTNLKLYETVKTFMIHGPCGSVTKSSPCMINSRCSKHFPKKFIERTSFDEDGYCKYRRRDSGHFVEKNGIKLDNRFVVPYNPTLLLRYQAHINVEFCNQSRSIKYLFKYVSKGYDKVTTVLCNFESNYSNADNVDEIKMYYDCRYISACEATWRIFGFDINFREPSVERLPFHLPNQQWVVFGDHDSIDSVVFNATAKQTKFFAWFQANKRYPKAKKSSRSIGRLYYVAPGLGELHYLRLLLTFTKGPTCYEDIRTINSVVYPTFKDVCYVMGLLDDDKEYIEGIIKGSKWSSGVYLRKRFATLLIHNTIARPSYVWVNTWMHLSDYILLKERHRTGNSDLHLDDEHVKDIALAEIENILKLNGHSLANFPPMPMPNQALMRNLENLLINEELNYDRNMLKLENDILLSSLTSEQKNIYDTIMAAVNDAKPDLFFVNGTAHSRFAIPLNIDGNSTCHIVHRSDLAELMVHTKLIIWDEAPMAHRHCFEALDRTLRDIMKSQNPELSQHPFGGKVVVFGGDFRQILPVIPRASRQDIVLASLNDSYLWSSYKGEERTYLSSDTMCNQQPTSEIVEVYTTEFLNTILGSGLPYHELKLKVGAPIMLLRNIDRSMGLCNGTRLILTRMCDHVIEASIMSGKFASEKVLIARMLITPTDSKLPFKFQRRQFPVVLSFAMSINKS